MTDISELGISVDSRSAVTAVTDMDKLVAAAGRAEKSVDQLGQTSIEAGTQMQKMIGAAVGISDEFKDAASSAEVFEASLNEQRIAFENLRASIDPVYAASMKYADAIDQIAIAQQLGVISAREADAAFRMAETRYLGVGDSMAQVGRAARFSSHDAKMLGFQLSQIAQQGMATGQWATAFSIQAADIGASFGIIGLAIGTLTTLALPTLVNYLTSSSDEAAGLEEAISDLSAGLDQYRQYIEQAAMSTGELTAEFGEFAAQIKGFSEFMAGVTLDNTFSGLEEKLEPLKMGLGGVQEAFNQLMEAEAALQAIDRTEYPQEWLNAADAVDVFRANLESAAAEFEILPSEALELANALDAIGRANGPKEMAVAATNALGVFERIRNRIGELPPALNTAAINTSKLQQEAAKTEAATENAVTAANNLTSAMGGAGAMYAQAYANAYNLANETERAATAARSMAAYQAELDRTGQSSGPDSARSRVQFGGGAFRAPVTGAGLPFVEPQSAGGGGGGSDEYSPRLQALISELEDERTIEDEWYQESLQILNDRRATELLTEAEHKEALLSLEEEYQSRIQQIEMAARQRRLSDTAGLFGALADIASAGGKKAAKAVATFQAIEGTINAYGAAIKALNTPGITLAGRFAAYASVLAAGLKGVAAIRSAGGSVGGGGSGGSASLPSVAAQGSQPTQQQNKLVVLGLRPEDVFTGKMIYDMFVTEADLRGGLNVELIGV